MKDRITRQLRQLYAIQRTLAGNLRVTMVPVQKLKDESSCGVYAAAFAFELASGAVTTGESLDFDFGAPTKPSAQGTTTHSYHLDISICMLGTF